eukprot:TRINITY_DN2835_c0_g1_i1.p1 TRINITY_DN2835_c0_g1~~TRINITY_DN2835_c0_g1_i1.p1  ORF type:complete len:720 (-),score=175.63 TRINITY_DN2835_c0_g1_i1:2336-4495(-)
MMYPYYQRPEKDSNAGRYAAPPLDAGQRFPSTFSSASASAQAYPPLGGLQMNGGPVVSGNRMNTGQMPPANPAMGRYQGPNMPGVPLQHPNMHGLHMPRSFGGNMGGVGMSSSGGGVNVPGNANSAIHQVSSGNSARQQPSSPMNNNRMVASTSTPGARGPNPPGTSNNSLSNSMNQPANRHVSYNLPSNMPSNMRTSLPLMQQGPSGLPNTYNTSENLLAMLNKGNVIGNNPGSGMPTYAQSINSKNLMNMNNHLSANGNSLPTEEQSPIDPASFDTEFPALPNQRSSGHQPNQEATNKQPDLSEEDFPALPGYKSTLLSNSGSSSNSTQSNSNQSNSSNPSSSNSNSNNNNNNNNSTNSSSNSNTNTSTNSNNSDMHNLPLPHPMHQQVHPSHLQHLQHLQQMSQLSSLTQQTPVQFTNLQHHPQLSSMPQHMSQLNQLSHLQQQLAQLPPQHQVTVQDRKEGESNAQNSMISSHYQPPLNNTTYASKAGLLNHPQNNMVYQNAARMNPSLHSAGSSSGNSVPNFSPYEQLLPLIQSKYTPQTKKPAQDRYGLQGLMSVLKMKDPDLNTLALGTDLISLGLNLHASEALFTTFTSPWAPPEFVLPECYSSLSLHPALTKIPLFSEDLLFYIFYSMPRDELQLAAAQQLYNKGWRYHKETQCWFMRVHEPLVKAANHEKGSYIYFDKNTWEKVRKDNYTLLYDQLETKKEMEMATSNS